MVKQPVMGQGLLIIEVLQSDSDTLQSVGLLWTSDKPDQDISTRQHTTLKRDRYLSFGETRTSNGSKRTTADPHPCPHCHWEQRAIIIIKQNMNNVAVFTVYVS
jgi:hypothetical protein